MDLVLVITFLPIVFICGYGFASVCYEIPRIQKFYFSHNSLEVYYKSVLMKFLNYTIEKLVSNNFLMQAKPNLWILFMLGCVSITIIVSYSVWILLRFTYYRKQWSNWIRRHGKLLLIFNKR